MSVQLSSSRGRRPSAARRPCRPPLTPGTDPASMSWRCSQRWTTFHCRSSVFATAATLPRFSRSSRSSSPRLGRRAVLARRRRRAARAPARARTLAGRSSSRICPAARERDRALHDLFQLAHVARPVVQAERAERRRLHPAEPGAAQVRHQRADVLDAIAQRRDHDRLRAQPPDQIRPHRSDTLLVAAMTRTSTRRVRVDPSGSTCRSCRKRNSFTCRRGDMSPISSSSSVPPSASSTSPCFARVAVECAPARVAEQLALDQLGRQRRAVDGDELAPAPRRRVHRPRVDLLADAGLAHEQQARRRCRQPPQSGRRHGERRRHASRPARAAPPPPARSPRAPCPRRAGTRRRGCRTGRCCRRTARPASSRAARRRTSRSCCRGPRPSSRRRSPRSGGGRATASRRNVI